MRRYSRDGGRVMSALANPLRFDESTLWVGLTPQSALEDSEAALDELGRYARAFHGQRRAARRRGGHALGARGAGGADPGRIGVAYQVSC